MRYKLIKNKHRKMGGIYNFANESAYVAFLKAERSTFHARYIRKFEQSRTISDFTILTTLGFGSYGTVVLVEDKMKENKFYAMKLIHKEGVIKNLQLEHTLSEKRVLQSINCGFTVYLKHFFMDFNFLYFVMPYIPGGDFFRRLQDIGFFPEDQTKFYAAQVLLALQYLHNLDLVYRDLKPENILIDRKGYVKITDFGFCKVVSGRTYTLCGTPDYIAPEVLSNRGYGKSADYWSFGILLYEMCAGFPPFIAPDLMKLYERIVSGKFGFPKSFSKDLKDLIKKLIQCDLSRRLGNLKDGAEGVKRHSWFKTVHWIGLLNCEVVAPFVPVLTSPDDTGNFDTIYEERNYHISHSNDYEFQFVEF